VGGGGALWPWKSEQGEGSRGTGNLGERGAKTLAIRRGCVDFFWNNPLLVILKKKIFMTNTVQCLIIHPVFSLACDWPKLTYMTQSCLKLGDCRAFCCCDRDKGIILMVKWCQKTMKSQLILCIEFLI